MKPFRWIKNNKGLAQTYTNIISTFVTLAALLATIYFSNKGISESEKSNRNATIQLVFAKKQFDLSVSEINRGRIKDKQNEEENQKKEQEFRRQKFYDSVRLHKIDSFQVVSFNKQNLINQEQLRAITKQANTAEAQFTLQSIQSADLYERNKAIFFPDTVILRNLRETASILSFRIVNTGNLWAHVDSTYVAVYNPRMLYFTDKTTNTNADLAQFGNYTTNGIPVFSGYINLEDTFYCLLVYYYDTADKKEKAFPKFFRYTYNAKKKFTLLPLASSDIDDFYKKMDKSNKYKRH